MITPAKPSRVVFLCPDLHEVGGIGAVSRLALAALQNLDAAPSQGGEVWSYGAAPAEPLRPGTTAWRFRYAHGRKSRATLWGLKAGVRHAHDTLVVAMHLHLVPLALPLVKRGARLAVFLHGIEAWAPLSRLRLAAMQQADILMANSRFTAQRFRSRNPQYVDTEICICPLGISLRDVSSREQTDVRPFALIVSRLSAEERYKGHDLLLEIWREVMNLVPGARLVVVGDGNDRQRLVEKARQLGLSDAVTFLGRVIDGQLDQLYRDSRFFVMPSNEEGFGLVFLEAMQAGKACLGGQGAAEEIILDGVTGLIVAPQDRQALLESVVRLFRDPALCDRMGQAGQERYRQQFTTAHFQERFFAALGLSPQPQES